MIALESPYSPSNRSDVWLRRNSAAYESLVRLIGRLASRSGADAVLAAVTQAAHFAATNHPGLFADHRLENLALGIGEELESRWPEHYGAYRALALPSIEHHASRRILHVATDAEGFAGRTRTIHNWALLDDASSHSLVLTGQRGSAPPAWLGEAMLARSGRVIVLPPEAPLLARARWLREIAATAADLVVSHHRWDDVIPLVAFADKDCPPVAIVNQTDHVFWLGSSAADTVLSLRGIGKDLSERRRGARHNMLLPVPLMDLSRMSRKAARDELGIPQEQVVLLSIGRPAKYVPSPSHNFFAAAERILADNPQTHLYLIGPSPEEVRAHLPRGGIDRLHCLGRVQDVAPYRAAADLYLESFPFAGQTPLLEAALAGLAVVRAYRPPSALLVASDESINALLDVVGDQDAYADRVSDLIAQPRKREALGEECRLRVLADHCEGSWLEHLAGFYAYACLIAHRPEPIAPLAFAAEEDDIAIAECHVHSGGRAALSNDRAGKLRSAVYEAACCARQWGDYAGAWRLIRAGRRLWGHGRGSIGFMARSLPHWLRRGGRVIRIGTPSVVGAGENSDAGVSPSSEYRL